MKNKFLCIALSILCIFSMLTIFTSAISADLVITTTDKFDTTPAPGGSFAYESVDGQSCIMVTKGTGDWPTIAINGLNVKISDYKYIVIKCYYTGTVATGRAPAIQIKSTVAGTTPWSTLRAKDASLGSLDTFKVIPGTWQYAIFPIESTDFTNTAKYPNGTADFIDVIQVYMFSNGGVKAVDMGADDKVYMKSITFTNSYENLLSSPSSDTTAAPGGDTTALSTTNTTTAATSTAPKTSDNLTTYIIVGIIISAMAAATIEFGCKKKKI